MTRTVPLDPSKAFTSPKVQDWCVLAGTRVSLPTNVNDTPVAMINVNALRCVCVCASSPSQRAFGCSMLPPTPSTSSSYDDDALIIFDGHLTARTVENFHQCKSRLHISSALAWRCHVGRVRTGRKCVDDHSVGAMLYLCGEWMTAA